MAAADIGANFSSYQGNANLGAVDMPAFQIDTRPLEMLAQYSYYYNREKFQQKQKELEAAAKEYASLTEYDLTNSIPKFSKEIQQKYNDLYKFVQDNPDVMDYKNNQKGWLEYKKRKQDFATDLLNAKSQDAIYKSAQAVIEAETNPNVKAFKQKQLDDQVASKDLATPIRLQQYDAKPTVIPTVPIKKFDVLKKDANGDILVDRKIGVADQKFINNTAAAMALGLMDEQLDVNSTSFKNLPLDVQKFKIEENKNREATGRLSIIEDAEVITEALKNPNFRDATTSKIDLTKVMASNPLISGSMKAILDYNKEMESEVMRIKNGTYSDNLGVLKFGLNGLEETDYQQIDFTDGEITATDLLKVKLKAKAPSTTYETASKELNNPLQEEQLRLQWANYGLAKRKLDQTDNADLLAADGVLREITDIINKGDLDANQVDVTDGNTGKTKRVFTIGDPNILQKFGNVDKDGTTTNVPDEARYNPKTNEIDLVYFERDGEGNVKRTADKAGGHFIKEQKTLNARTWANLVSQRTFSGQDRGNVNEIIQNVITKNGGDLYKIAKALNTIPTTQTEAPKQNGGMTDAQYQEFLKKNGLK